MLTHRCSLVTAAVPHHGRAVLSFERPKFARGLRVRLLARVRGAVAGSAHRELQPDITMMQSTSARAPTRADFRATRAGSITT